MFVVYLRFVVYISRFVDLGEQVVTAREAHGQFLTYQDGEAFLAKQRETDGFDDGEVLALMPPDFVVENARLVPAAFQKDSLGWDEFNGTEFNLTFKERRALGYYAIGADNT